jgi:RNA polymerase sigma factor (sigma-70 family)
VQQLSLLCCTNHLTVKHFFLITPLIIQGSINNDRKCQRILYDACYPLMMRISKRYCLNDEDAKDTLNTSFVKIIKNLTALQSETAFFSWVKQITVRTAIDNFRKKKLYNDRNKFSIDNDLTNYNDTYASEDFTEQKLAAIEIFILINQLPDVTKAVLNIVAIDGFSHREAAQFLNISEENSRRHLSKARTILSEKIKQTNNVSNILLRN